MIRQLLKNKQAGKFFSFVIGLGFALLLFHKTFLTRKVLALPVSDIMGQVVRSGDKCYKYTAEDTQCEILPSK